MNDSNALTAHGVRSVHVPQSLPFEIQDDSPDVKRLIIGNQGHQHELILQLLEGAVLPAHADVEHVTVEATGVTKGKSATATVEVNGLSVVAGCPAHPFKFVLNETREGVIEVAGMCFDESNIWPNVDQYEEQTGSVTFRDDEILYSGEGEFGTQTENASMPRRSS